jgi:DNA-binding GntR family transcriptional regulator
MPATKARSPLHSDLAARILRSLHDQGAGAGHHLVERDLCQELGVSRTPVRAALQLLAEQGCVRARANRGFILLKPVSGHAIVRPVHPREERDSRLFNAIATAYNTGTLPAQLTQQQVVRQFGVRLPTVLRVMHRLAELGLAQRNPGTGWSITASTDPTRMHSDSIAFRRALEPAMLLQPTFKLDRAWARQARLAHLKLRRAPWRAASAVDFFEMNCHFHTDLARWSGNSYMLNAMQLQIQLSVFIRHQWTHDAERANASIDEHLAILDALEENRNRDAAMMMEKHLLAGT